MDYDKSRFLSIGFVLRAHGVRGELHVRLHNEGSTTLEEVRHIYLFDSTRGTVEQYGLIRVRRVERGALCALEGVSDRTVAEGMKGRQVLVSRSELRPLAEDEFYLSDLEGCEVVTQRGEHYGIVAGIESYGAHEILVIQSGTVEKLLPFVEGFVCGVDLQARRITIDPPEGLPEQPIERSRRR